MEKCSYSFFGGMVIKVVFIFKTKLTMILEMNKMIYKYFFQRLFNAILNFLIYQQYCSRYTVKCSKNITIDLKNVYLNYGLHCIVYSLQR